MVFINFGSLGFASIFCLNLLIKMSIDREKIFIYNFMSSLRQKINKSAKKK